MLIWFDVDSRVTLVLATGLAVEILQDLILWKIRRQGWETFNLNVRTNTLVGIRQKYMLSVHLHWQDLDTYTPCIILNQYAALTQHNPCSGISS